MAKTRMLRLGTLAGGLAAASLLAVSVSPAFAHGRVVHSARRAAPTVVIRLETVHIGKKAVRVLATAQGLTLYYLANATVQKDACVGKCAVLWPPLTAPKGAKVVGPKGITGFTVAETAGREQVIFRGHPMFRFYLDKKPGEAFGEGFKKIWWVATPALKGWAGAAATKSGSKSSSSGW